MVKRSKFLWGSPVLKTSIILIIFLISSLSVNAEELWGCNAFTASRDGSKLSPFVLRGNGDEYYWQGEFSNHRIKKVSENGVMGFDIFVDVGTNLSRNAFYIKKRERKLVMKAYYWDMPHFFTEYFRQ